MIDQRGTTKTNSTRQLIGNDLSKHWRDRCGFGGGAGVGGRQVSLAHATYVHKLKQSPDETDWSDARLLVDLLRVGYLP